jgi:hypothetical protein
MIKIIIIILLILLIIYLYNQCLLIKKNESFIDINHNLNKINMVLIHLGDTFPIYILDCIHQFRIFNKDANLFLLCDDTYNIIIQKYLPYILSYNIILINIHHIDKSQIHLDFIKKSTLDKDFRNGFWFKTAQRFFVLEDFVLKYNINNIFHIEYDNLIYMDISNILKIINSAYNDSAGIFDNDYQCIASFIYFKNKESLQSLTQYLFNNQQSFPNEMASLGAYRKENPNLIQHLPILTKDYLFNNDNIYTNNSEYFNCIFDGRAIGQYVGGVDPNNINGNTEGFINKDVIFNVSKINFNWKKSNNKYIPFACDVPVVNLHIHCKNLLKWSSDRESKFDISQIITGERLQQLFLNYNHLYFETDHIDINKIKLTDNNIILTHNSDHHIDNTFLELLDSDKIKYWFAQNTAIKHPKLINVPIGLANSKWGHGNLEIFSKFLKTSYNKEDKDNKDFKDNLCYFGFSVTTYLEHRMTVRRSIELTCPTFKFLENLSFEDYLNKLSKSKYCICPRGNGIDTHRLWECLYLQVIPIVDRNCVTEAHENLGLLIVDDWNTITEEFLINNYDNYYKKINILTMKFYEDIVQNISS